MLGLKLDTFYTSISGINGTADGLISFPFPDDLLLGGYTYDIQVTSTNGDIQTFVKSTLEIIDDVSL